MYDTWRECLVESVSNCVYLNKNVAYFISTLALIDNNYELCILYFLLYIFYSVIVVFIIL